MTNRLWLLTFFFFFFTCRNTLRPLTHTKMLSVKNFLLNFNMFWKCFGWLKSFKSSKSYIKLNVYWQYTNLHHLLLTFRLLQMRTVYYHSGVQKHVLECWLNTEVGWLYWCIILFGYACQTASKMISSCFDWWVLVVPQKLYGLVMFYKQFQTALPFDCIAVILNHWGLFMKLFKTITEQLSF